MAFQPEAVQWETGIIQWETNTPALGGVGGIMNTPLLQLANRTLWLKGQIEAASGVAPGTYPKVAVNARGQVTAGAALSVGDIPPLDWSKITTGKPTTVAGYGISDMWNQAVAWANGAPWVGISGKPNTVAGYGISDMGSQAVAWANGAPWVGISGKPNSIDGFGIFDGAKRGGAYEIGSFLHRVAVETLNNNYGVFIGIPGVPGTWMVLGGGAVGGGIWAVHYVRVS